MSLPIVRHHSDTKGSSSREKRRAFFLRQRGGEPSGAEKSPVLKHDTAARHR